MLSRNPYDLGLYLIKDQWDLFRTIARVRKEEYDLALGFSYIGGFFTKLSAAKNESDFFTVGDWAEQSVVNLCLKVLADGCPTCKVPDHPGSSLTEFWLEDQDYQNVAFFLKKAGLDGGAPLLAVHCGGHYFSRKRWPIEKYIRLIQVLSLDWGFQVVLVGGKEDMNAGLAIKAAIPRTVTAVGVLKLAETAALLKQCRLLIGNDSGPLHLGAAIGTKTIGLFGPTDPKQFYPYNPVAHRYIYHAYPCSPCYRFGGPIFQYLPRCSRAFCMEKITTRDVLDQVERILAIPRKLVAGNGEE